MGTMNEGREAWAAEAVRALLAAVPVKAEPNPIPPPANYPHPPITAREWIRIREQRALDIAYTQSVAVEIRLRWALKGAK